MLEVDLTYHIKEGIIEPSKQLKEALDKFEGGRFIGVEAPDKLQCMLDVSSWWVLPRFPNPFLRNTIREFYEYLNGWPASIDTIKAERQRALLNVLPTTS